MDGQEPWLTIDPACSLDTVDTQNILEMATDGNGNILAQVVDDNNQHGFLYSVDHGQSFQSLLVDVTLNAVTRQLTFAAGHFFFTFEYGTPEQYLFRIAATDFQSLSGLAPADEFLPSNGFYGFALNGGDWTLVQVDVLFAHGNDLWVFGEGDEALLGVDFRHIVWQSNDAGENFSLQSSNIFNGEIYAPGGRPLSNAAAFGSGSVVALTQAGTYDVYQNQSWSGQLNAEIVNQDSNLVDIVFDGSKFIAVGNDQFDASCGMLAHALPSAISSPSEMNAAFTLQYGCAEPELPGLFAIAVR